MAIAIDISGKRFGRLTAIKRVGKTKKWVCLCDCGTKTNVFKNALFRPNGTKSCGCLISERMVKYNRTHGKSNTGTFKSWASMKSRCLNPNATGYKRYGGSGIKICKKWLASFEGFLEDMGERPRGYTLERIDNKKGYTKSNCKWATKAEQNANRRTNNLVTINGRTQTVSEWSRETGLARHTIVRRLKSGRSLLHQRRGYCKAND